MDSIMDQVWEIPAGRLKLPAEAFLKQEKTFSRGWKVRWAPLEKYEQGKTVTFHRGLIYCTQMCMQEH